MRKWKGDPLMTAQDLSRKSGEYRRRAFLSEVEALKKESACSAEALSAYAERALNGGFKPLTREEQAKAKAAAERAAREAGKAARDRLLILAGYDPLLVAREGRPPRKNAVGTAGSAGTSASAPEPHAPGYGAVLSRASAPASTILSPSIHPVVPAEIRSRAQAAYTRAYNAALGDPLASPQAGGGDPCGQAKRGYWPEWLQFGEECKCIPEPGGCCPCGGESPFGTCGCKELKYVRWKRSLYEMTWFLCNCTGFCEPGCGNFIYVDRVEPEEATMTVCAHRLPAPERSLNHFEICHHTHQDCDHCEGIFCWCSDIDDWDYVGHTTNLEFTNCAKLGPDGYPACIMCTQGTCI